MNAEDAVTPGAVPFAPELMRLVKADHPFDGLSSTRTPSNFFLDFFVKIFAEFF